MPADGPPIDVYSFGMVLYEVAERAQPFHDVTAFGHQLERLILNGERPTLTEACPSKYFLRGGGGGGPKKKKLKQQPEFLKKKKKK